jgi:hypothetical protein
VEHAADQKALVAAPSAEPPPAASASEAPAAEPALERPRRWGDRSAEITGCRLLDGKGEERYALQSGEPLTLEIAVRPARALSDVVFGVGVFTPEDVCVLGTNTEIDGLESSSFTGPAVVRVSLPRCELGEGTYLVDVAVHAKNGTPFDYWRGAIRLHVTSPSRDAGVYRPERTWTSTGGLTWR